MIGQGGWTDVVIYGLMAAAATGIGGLLPILFWRPGYRFLAASLGVAGGAMLSITILGLVPMALQQRPAGAMLGLVIGLLAFATLDEILSHRDTTAIACDLIPTSGPAGEAPGGDSQNQTVQAALVQTADLVALAIPLHGVAEGLAIGAGVSAFPGLGLVIAAALIVHKLPEGIAIATPLVALGRAKSFVLRVTITRGLALLVGALLGLFVAGTSPLFLSVMLGIAGGAMLYISIDEMLHNSHQCGHPQVARWGMIAGMLVMTPVIWVSVS
jgi:ZIP family zinc transporter